MSGGRTIERGGLVARLTLFYVVAVGLFLSSTLLEVGGVVDLPGPVALLLGVGSPTVAALVVVATTEDRAAVGELLGRYTRVRHLPGLAVLTSVFFVVPLAVGLLTEPAGRPLDQYSAGDLAARALVTLVVGPLSEEGGWRGYALPRLLRLCSRVRASVVLGVAWGLWHVPLWFEPESIQRSLPGGPYLSVLTFTALAAVLSIVYTGVFLRSGGSLPAVIALHFWFNLSGSLLVRGYEILTPDAFFATHAVLVAVAALVVLRSWRRRP